VKIKIHAGNWKANTKTITTTIEFAECAEGNECFISGLESNFPATEISGLPLDTTFLRKSTKRSFKNATIAM